MRLVRSPAIAEATCRAALPARAGRLELENKA